MFGTTKRVKNNEEGYRVYIWRVTLDSTNNYVDVNSLIGKRLRFHDIEPKSFVTGIHKKLLGANSYVIHLVYWDYSNKELWYLIANLNNTVSSIAYRLYEDIHVAGDTWFALSNSYETFGSETEMLQSYTGVSAKDITSDKGTKLAA